MKAITAKNTLIEGEWQQDLAIVIEDGQVRSIDHINQLDPAISVEQFNDGYLVPGFFDIQVNGGGGVLLNDQPNTDGIKTVAAAHRRFGTTSLLPTLISDRWEIMQRMAGGIEDAIRQKIPGIRGVHFEGPYLNQNRKGVHNQNFIRAAEEKFLDLIEEHDLGAVLVTLAPETVSSDYISKLISAGAVVSAGHTTATYEQARQAMQTGLRGFTHLYNAMPPFLSREPGIVGAALEGTEGYCGIIVDGQHVHPATLKAAIAAKGVDKMMLVTDAMPPVGTDMQAFQLQGQTIHVKEGRCSTSEGTLAGSSLNMEEAIHNSCRLLNCTLAEAVLMASSSPSHFMGLEKTIGSIRVGTDADMLILSKEGRIQETF